MLWPVALCVALVGAGFVAGRAMRPAPPPLVIERGALNSPLPAPQIPASGKQAAANAAANANTNASVYGADGTARERPTEAAEIVSICGARTKRGTPCSRRVRGTGRCWQHRGKSAMLPASKLIVPE